MDKWFKDILSDKDRQLDLETKVSRTRVVKYMDKWLKDILPDKDPYHNRGRDQMRKKGGPEFECLWNEGVDDFF